MAFHYRYASIHGWGLSIRYRQTHSCHCVSHSFALVIVTWFDVLDTIYTSGIVRWQSLPLPPLKTGQRHKIIVVSVVYTTSQSHFSFYEKRSVWPRICRKCICGRGFAQSPQSAGHIGLHLHCRHHSRGVLIIAYPFPV